MADLSAQLVRGKQAAFQYEPIVSEDLSWLARTENQRNYLESERKRKEQENLRDQLIKIQQLGLPKEMQGYLNSQVKDVIAKVRSGEINPLTNEYDLRSAIAGIGGEAKQLNTINENLKTLVVQDKQVIGFDDLGAKDLAPEYRNQYFGSYSTDYKPGTEVVNKYLEILNKLNSGTDAIKFDPTKLDTALKNFLDRNQELSAAASKFPGVTGLALIKKLTSVDKDAVNKWNTFVDEAYGVDVVSSYAADRGTVGDKAIGSMVDYTRARTNPWKIDAGTKMTDFQVREDVGVKAELDLALAKAKKNLEKANFTVVSDSFELPEAVPERLETDVQYQNEVYQNIVDSMPGKGLSIEAAKQIYNYFPAKATIKQSLITTTGEGKELSKLTLGEQEGVIDRVLSSDGKYVAVINVTEVEKEIEGEGNNMNDKKVIEKKITKKMYVPIEEIDVRKIEENYGVSILNGAKNDLQNPFAKK